MPASASNQASYSVVKTYKRSGSPEITSSTRTVIATTSALEDKIRLLQEDLEYERELRQRVEREKADLSVTVIQLSERIEEVEAGADGQVEINRKRDAELTKLRKLLEDIHLESEQTQFNLKKKHTESVTDFQDQIDILTKSRSKIEKEKAKYQQEALDLGEQLERVTVENVASMKTVKSLHITIQELNIRIEELNRSVVDITSSKQRISVENIELTKIVQELKVRVEDLTYQYKSATGSMEEFRRRFEEEEQRRRKLESDWNILSQELSTLRASYDEECDLRTEVERRLSNESANAAAYKSKWEQECRARAEEIDELKKKMHIRITEFEETITMLQQKIAGVEKAKQRLSQELEVMILDLEKANNSAREYKSKLEILEREHKTLTVKYEEISILYDQTSRDLKARIQDLTKATHDIEILKEHNERFVLDNKRLSGENSELKGTVADLGRIRHELEIEVRRLETERNELASALQEADHARKEEEAKCLKISNEYSTYKTFMDRKLMEKEEELESVRKQMAMEVDQLNARVVEAETRLKSEVSKIKKKMQITITELEMTLDTANKMNIDLQKTVKKLSLQLHEIQGAYDDIQRQLQQTLDLYGVSQRKLQTLTVEYEELKSQYDAAIRARKSAEMQYEEASNRVKELSTINVNISNAKSKLEQEIAIIAGDYDEVSKELRIADERLQKTTIDLKRTTELYHEESERVIKIESIKKSLEIEVKNLTVRIENIEANALANTKRMVSKLEARVHDLEVEIDEERRRHIETTKIMKKKERNVKELVLQCEEDNKNIQILQETLDKTYEKLNLYKRQINEQESLAATNVSRVRRYQRELDAAEERAETAESNLSMIRSKHRTFVTSTSALPSGEQVIVKETVTESY